MKKFIYTALCGAAFIALPACSDFLETTSPSVVDESFVFSDPERARSTMHNTYETWRGVGNSYVFGAGLFYASDITGSDIERHPEPFASQYPRHWPESLYNNGNQTAEYDIDSYNSVEPAYTNLFSVIGLANAVISAMEGTDGFEEMMNAGEPSQLGQIYGEAVAMRATCYRELIKYFGDVPLQTVFGEPAERIAPRDSIYDVCIADLKRVEPVMYVVGTAPGFDGSAKNYLSKTYVQGLIGRMALDAAGYQTRRTDMGADFYKDGEGNVLTFDKKGNDHHGATYGRRSDYMQLYQTAKEYLGRVIANSGTARFIETDPRTAEFNGMRAYGNPYQYFFQEMLDDDYGYATESIYEYPQQQGTSTERPYSSGRVSGGGSSNAYPCKSYGQARIQPVYYYGHFDPKDLRRDVAVCVTGSDGAGRETLIPFVLGSTNKGGGLTLNKWDENRQISPQSASQRQSGINGPYMRLSEIYLSYAEVCAVTGDTGTATEYLSKIRNRAFGGNGNTAQFIADCGGLLEAIVEERGFEFAGEGDRRWTLLRLGMLGDKIRAVKAETKAMIDGLRTNGYYTFPKTGNTISAYVYTKSVDAKSQYGFRLTAQCPDENDPVLYPGWRGQNDDWSKFDSSGKFTNPSDTNLAIKGLFAPVSAAEEAALLADGYTKVNWGIDLVNNETEYVDYCFYNWDYESAPIYLYPFGPTVCASTGFHNGYGFQDE